eukprot:TRINITY_DN566_c0_g1_i1.p1 TRINITY_DN566_c0_g1~~TRINITY_DN566_c0_g1_i1.p1  ORF type:complete len:224 (+),score=78.41 TRINITY_DN566_c0_g1_i1:601-1272(+)
MSDLDYKTLFVKNLPKLDNVSKERFQAIFSEFGKVNDFRILFKKSMAFVEYESAIDAGYAYTELNRSFFNGNKLFINFARAREDNSKKVKKEETEVEEVVVEETTPVVAAPVTSGPIGGEIVKTQGGGRSKKRKNKRKVVDVPSEVVDVPAQPVKPVQPKKTKTTTPAPAPQKKEIITNDQFEIVIHNATRNESITVARIDSTGAHVLNKSVFDRYISDIFLN